MRIFDFIFSLLFIINLFFGFNSKDFNSSDRDKLLLEIISYVIEKGHYNPKNIDDDFSKNVFNSYIDIVDGQHRYFLKADINNFNRFKTEIDDQLKSTNIDFFNLVFDKIQNRINQVKEFYPELLDKPFDFSIKETTSLNYKELPYSSNLSELKNRWRKRFKLSTLDRFVTKKEQEMLKKSKDSSYNIKSDEVLEKESRAVTKQNIDDYFEIINEMERKDYFNVFVNSVVTEFDPHTYYFAPKEKELFDTTMSGKFEGIGARLTKRNEKVKIVEVILGGPVWKNNLLQAGDEILMVAQQDEEPVDISGMRLDDSIKLIKGPKGTNVILTVKKVSGTVEDITIKRDIVILEESYAKSAIINKNEKKFGLIQLPKFYVDFKDYGERNAATDVKKAIMQFKKNSVDGIVIDLRNNGGGSLKTVVDMTGYFIDEGPVVQVKSTGGRKEVLEDTDPSLIWDGPLVVLVNEFSASASEILAAALQDYRRAIILGSDQTYGKGTVQNVIDLNKIIAVNQHGDLGALKITTDKFYRINGGSTQLEGVKSDVVFPSRYNSIEIGEKDQSNPLGWDRISPATYSSWTKNIQYNYITSKSKNRIDNNPLIKLILEQGEWIRLKQNDFNYNLGYDEFINERDSDEAYSKKFKVLEDFDSGLSIKWLPDSFEIIESSEDLKTRRNRWVKSLSKDMYIEEAVNILNDLNQNLNEFISLNQSK